AARAEVRGVRVAGDARQRPRLRAARSRVRGAAAAGWPTERDRRRYRPQQRPALDRGQGRSLVRAPDAAGSRATDRRASWQRARPAALQPHGGGMMQATLYERTLLRIAQSDPDLVVMTAENRAALRSLPAALGARFIDVGIAEQTMIGMAAGLALRGRKP